MFTTRKDINVLPGEEEITHTNTRPFCSDMACPCHEDEPLIEVTNQYIQDGLLIESEADRLYRGQQL